MRPIEVKEEKPSETVNAKVSMIQDDDRKWALYIKPEGEKGFAMYPDKADLGRFYWRRNTTPWPPHIRR